MAQQTTIEQQLPAEPASHNSGYASSSRAAASTRLPARQETFPNLVTVMLYSELRKQVCLGNSGHKTNDEIDFILQCSSSYFRCRNILARIIQLKQRNKSMLELQNEAENKIFEEFPQQADSYVKTLEEMVSTR
jgi:hypothetical protein